MRLRRLQSSLVLLSLLSFASGYVKPILTRVLSSPRQKKILLHSTIQRVETIKPHKLSYRELKRELASLEIDTNNLDTKTMQDMLASSARTTTTTETAADSSATTATASSTPANTKTTIIGDVSFRWDRSPESGGSIPMTSSACITACQEGNWKKGLRKLKQLKSAIARESGDEGKVSEEVYNAILRSLARAHLQGGRAGEPARKIIEEMVLCNYALSSTVVNTILTDSLGSSYTNPSTGKSYVNPAQLDVTLAVIDALGRSVEQGNEGSPLLVEEEVWEGLIKGLVKEESISEAIALLRRQIVSFSSTPTLLAFSSVASAAARLKMTPDVLSLLALVKASGYSLDSIGNTASGRLLLASGVIAAEKQGNIALGLRLLTAAQKAEGCSPDRGDLLTILSSSQAQNSALVLHSKAIQTGCSVGNWKLATDLLDLMAVRELRPNQQTYLNVINVLSKEEKSRKATKVLFDWIELSKTTALQPPSVQTFNNIVNCCEVCGESDLTTTVLDKMKEIHSTDGNTITFNIALKRLAKIGNTAACEGLIMGMLAEGVEPSVVTYTTVIGACAHNKDSELAFEWIRRMKIKGCAPNFHTYNTAFSACLDGTLEGTQRAAALAKMMIEDVDNQLKQCDVENSDEKLKDFISLLPDTYTKKLARELMKQLRDNWTNGDVDKDIARMKIRPAFKDLVDFTKEEELKKLKVGDQTSMEDCVISVQEDTDYTFVRRLREEV